MKSTIQMHENYPFGQHTMPCQSLQDLQVVKKLTFTNQKQLHIIKTMLNLMTTLQNQHLIHINNSKFQGEDQVLLFYEYVPLTLEKWILDLGEQIADQLEFQMLGLANYLANRNIKFRFDPKCLGLDKEMKIKYFLQEFMMDPDNKMQNFKMIEKEIKHFFWGFKYNKSQNDETSTQYTERLSVDTVMLPSRPLLKNDRSSWEVGTKTSINAQKIKKKMLSQKVEKSKQKSLEVLMKLKAIRLKTQEK